MKHGICIVNALMNSHVEISLYRIIHAKSQNGKVTLYEGIRVNGTAFKTDCLNEETSAAQHRNDKKYEICETSGIKKPSSVRYST
jgi:hypothetical protein